MGPTHQQAMVLSDLFKHIEASLIDLRADFANNVIAVRDLLLPASSLDEQTASATQAGRQASRVPYHN